LIFAFAGLLLPIFGQVSLVLERSVPAKSSNFRVDPLGYTIWFAKDVVYKMDTTGNLMFQQSVKAFGEITDMDLINPMKYLVFFREQQLIGFFDNTFTPYQQKTRLSDLDISYATLVCYSLQFDRFWVFDQDNSKLILFNSEGKRTLETDNLNGLIGLKNPVQMLERLGKLYVVDEFQGVYVFDMFGSLIDFARIDGVEWIDVDENNLFYILKNEFRIFNLKSRMQFTIPLNISALNRFQMVKEKLYLQTIDSLLVHTIK